MKKNDPREKLYHSLSDIDPAYIEEAKEPLQQRPSRASWKKWGALAACLCLIGAGLVSGLHRDSTSQPTGEIPSLAPGAAETATAEPTESTPTAHQSTAPAENTPPAPAATPQPTTIPLSLQYNEIPEVPQAQYAMINLSGEDFRTMDAQEALDTFGIPLQADGTLAGLSLTEGGCLGLGYGKFETAERGVYYDINTFVFSAEGKRITLTARTTFSHMRPTSEQVSSGPDDLTFTEIKGWHLVLFRCPDEASNPLVYTEFVLGDTVCSLSAIGLTDAEFAEALGQILPAKASPADGITTCTGTVRNVENRTEDYYDGSQHHVSEHHDWLEVDVEGTQYTVWLPGTADVFQAGDQITLTYKGEPATAYNIWPGQLLSVEQVG